jgi:ABC-2 type transport system permease protein
VGVSRALGALLRRDLQDARTVPLAAVSRVVALALAVASTHLVARAVVGAPRTDALPGGYFGWLLTGFLFADLAHAVVSGAAERLRTLQLQGGLELELQGPVRGAAYFLGLTLFPVSTAAARVVAVLLVAWLAFDLIPTPSVAGLGVLVLGLAALVPLGVLAAAATLVLKRADPVGRVVGALSMLLSGVAYPRDVLPEALASFAAALPTTPALDAFRAGLFGGPVAPGLVVHLALALAVLTPLAVLVARAADHEARRRGRLGAD